MPNVTINVEVYCKCGEGLCLQTESKFTAQRQEPCFIVAPCSACLDEARDAGQNQGYDDAKKEYNG